MNSSFQDKVPEAQLADCENYTTLLNVYGPDYNKLRPKLGYIKGLFV
jgi:hypothetical protein